MISSTTIPENGVVGLRLEPFKFRTVSYKIELENVFSLNKVLYLNKEGWKDFHEAEHLKFEQVVLIIAKPTTRSNLNMMFVMNTI